MFLDINKNTLKNTSSKTVCALLLIALKLYVNTVKVKFQDLSVFKWLPVIVITN